MRLLTLTLALALLGCAMQEEKQNPDRGRPAEARKGNRSLAPLSAGGSGGDREPAPEMERLLAAGPSLAAVRRLALERNPDVRAALERYRAALEVAPQRTALPYPTFRYGYSSMFKMHAYEAMQEVPFPTKLRDEGRAARAEARAMGAEYEERKNALREQAQAAFAALHLARRELALLDENQDLLARFLETARAAYAAGRAAQADVLRVEVEHEGLRAERAERAREVEVQTSALNALLDRPPDAPIGPLGDLPRPPSPTAEAPVAAPPPAAALIERALESRPELAAAAARVAAAEAMLSRAEGDWIPDLALGGAYVRDFGLDENEVEATAGITLPIWAGKISAGIAEAEANARRARAELRAARNRVRDEVRRAAARVAAAAERYRVLAGTALARARQNVAVSETAYATGGIDLLALIDSQRTLLAQQREAERALADYAVRLAELERAVGNVKEEEGR